MNPLSQLKKAAPVFLVTLVCFGLLPKTRAVSPAPDGGYPGGNTAEGQAALLSLTTGGFNTGVGFLSLRSNTTGSFNTAIGAGTLLFNTESDNTATGATALFSNTTGSDNTATGFQALFSNTSGGANTATGAFALFHNTSGESNTAIGAEALNNNTVGSGNTAIGPDALNFNISGSGNIALGTLAGSNIQTANNTICILAPGVDVSGTCFIGNIRGVTPQNPDAIPVLIDSAGQLGTTNSSRRYKTDIRPMDKASESILALNPVSFRYKVHKDSTPQFGLIAEEVAEVNPNLVIYDSDGKPYTVRYDAVNAMLLNEFLKEHRSVQQLKSTVAKQETTAARQEAIIAKQQKQVEALTAGLQKVSAQLAAASPSRGGLELSKTAPQIVNRAGKQKRKNDESIVFN